MISNHFTVDVEDYYHVEAFSRYIPPEDWPRYPRRVVRNTRKLLDILDRHGAGATFFVLGICAEENPALVKEISSRGHEVASHGYSHRPVYRMSREEFRSDYRRSRNALEDITGVPVPGYRAPTFSITAATEWAFDILAEEGCRYSSSVFPVRHDRYGWPGFPDGPVEVRPGLREFPLATVRVGPLRLPVGGGGYFRIYPLALSLCLLERINAERKRPFIFYVHPWEVDEEHPRLPFGGPLRRMRHYWNISRNSERLDALLGHFRFVAMEETMGARGWGSPSGGDH